MKSSGATNRQRQQEADAARRAEEAHAPRCLSALPPERAAQARALMVDVLTGRIGDPDAAAEEPAA